MKKHAKGDNLIGDVIIFKQYIGAFVVDVLESFWFLLFIGFRICLKRLPVECILYLHKAPNCGNSQNGWNDWKLEKKNTCYCTWFLLIVC